MTADKKHNLSDGWASYKLDDITIRGSGHTPSQRHAEYWDGDIRWLSLADSSSLNRGLVCETSRNITALGIKKSSAVLHPPGTVVLLRDAGVGRSAILGKEMAVSQHFIAWKTDEAKLHNRYLYQWFQWKNTEFERMAVGSTVRTIGLPYFKKLSIRLPPLEMQRRISDRLFLLDEAITSAEQLIVLCSRRKQGLMQQLLTGRRRLKGFKGKWKTVRLGSVLARVTRKNTSACLTPLTVSAQRGLVEQGSYFAKQIAAIDNEHYLLLKRGEFAYNRSASIGYPFGAIKRLDTFDEGIVSTLCLCFSVADDETTDSDFLVGLIEAGLLNRQLRAVAHEGARSHGLLNVTATDFFNIRVSLPGIDEQRAMAEVLRATDTELTLRRLQLGELKTQKRALMQKLLSGEWRLPGKPVQAKFLSKKGLQPPITLHK